MSAVVQHGRNIPADFSECVFPYYGKCDSSRPYIFLCPAIYQRILAYIHWPAHDVGGHVRYQRYRTGCSSMSCRQKKPLRMHFRVLLPLSVPFWPILQSRGSRPCSQGNSWPHTGTACLLRLPETGLHGCPECGEVLSIAPGIHP